MSPLLAHPLTDAGGLGVPPYAVALSAVVVVAAVAVLAPIRAAGEPTDDDGFADVDTSLGWPRRVTRAIVLIAVLLLAYAGRRGSADGLSNITPPLVVGVAWAALVVGALAIPRLWTWLDPWDAAARAAEPRSAPIQPQDPEDADDSADAPARISVWPATAAAFFVVYFLVARVDSTQPRVIGAGLAAYTIVAIALGIGLGRHTLARSDVFGLTARWAGELRDRLCATWRVPAGAEVVLGVIAGGLLLDVARRAGAYADVVDLLAVNPTTAFSPRGLLIALALVCAVTAGVMHIAERMCAERGGAGAVALAVMPVVIVLVVVWRIRRLLVSLQLLPVTASDPLGRGWDLFGTSDRIVDPNPFGTSAQRWTAIALVVVAGVVGAVVLRRRVADRRARDVASYVLYLLVGLSILGLAVAA